MREKSARYNLVLEASQGADLLNLSERRRVSVVKLISRFCELGVLESKRGPLFCVDEHGERREIEVFPPKKDERKLRLWMYGSVLSMRSLSEQRHWAETPSIDTGRRS